MFAQRVVFPGYRDPVRYELDETPKELMEEMWAAVHGAKIAEPPFEPPGPWMFFCKFRADQQKEFDRTHFDNDNPELARWFERAIDTASAKGREVKTVPNWIADHPRLRKFIAPREDEPARGKE